MFDIQSVIARASDLAVFLSKLPWQITQDAVNIVKAEADKCQDDDWKTIGDAVAHVTAIVSESAHIEGPAVIGPYCQIKPGAYLREGVWLAKGVVLGSYCEVKSSFIFGGSRISHLNYVGNSILGEDVNIEAGAVLANHWNERNGESIFLRTPGGERIHTGVSKFGAIVGDGARIGANAVTCPGVVLARNAVVDRLELIR